MGVCFVGWSEQTAGGVFLCSCRYTSHDHSLVNTNAVGECGQAVLPQWCYGMHRHTNYFTIVEV